MSLRMSMKEFAAIDKQPKKSKYKNKIAYVDDIRFDSLAEAAYYERLKILQKAGEVSHFLMQVPFVLPGPVRYRLDFLVFYSDGAVDYIDIKGKPTAEFKTKKKLVAALYPVKIRCLGRKGYNFYEKDV